MFMYRDVITNPRGSNINLTDPSQWTKQHEFISLFDFTMFVGKGHYDSLLIPLIVTISKLLSWTLYPSWYIQNNKDTILFLYGKPKISHEGLPFLSKFQPRKNETFTWSLIRIWYKFVRHFLTNLFRKFSNNLLFNLRKLNSSNGDKIGVLSRSLNYLCQYDI